MKKLFILLVSLSFVSVFAQDDIVTSQDMTLLDTVSRIKNIRKVKIKQSRAEKYFDKMWYVKSAKEYTRLYDKGDTSQKTISRLADSYYFNSDMEKASEWYSVLYDSYKNAMTKSYLFKYIHSLKGSGNYVKANQLMKIHKIDHKEVSDLEDSFRVEQFSKPNTNFDKVQNMIPQFIVNNVSINTKYADFSPMFYGDKLVFASSKDTSYVHKRRYHWNEQPFLDLFIADADHSTGRLKNISYLSKEVNTKYHEASVAFTSDLKTMYFTRNNFEKGDLERDTKGVNRLKLYKATWIGKLDSTSIVESQIDSLETDLSKKERRKIERIQQGKSESGWGNIVELPFNNRDYSVGHPTLSKDNKKLYFISDMPGSMGLTDIYVVDILEDNKGYSEPRNLGDKINTSGREMFPFVSKDKLYFSSDGYMGLGALDVFESRILEDTFGKPKNLGAPLNSKMDDFGFVINEESKRGYFSSNRDGGKGDDDIYAFERIKQKTMKEEKKEEEELIAESKCLQKIIGKVVDKNTGYLIAEATVCLYNNTGEKIDCVVVGSDAKFNFEVDCETNYKVDGNKITYVSDEKMFASGNGEEELELNLNLNITKKPLIDPNEKYADLFFIRDGKRYIKINPIYFDLNKDAIRPDAARELEKVVYVMNKFPNMIVQGGSHTDSRGSTSYNSNLSNRRAASTMKYITNERGIDRSRISCTGYGETQLLNDCFDGKKCSKEKHQVNRRTEFMVIRLE